MQKAPDYERIQQTLASKHDSLDDDEELWVQNYLELADKALNPKEPATIKIPS